MQDRHPRWDRAIGHHPTQAMGTERARMPINAHVVFPIAITELASAPEPTTVQAALAVLTALDIFPHTMYFVHGFSLEDETNVSAQAPQPWPGVEPASFGSYLPYR
jgi:hypothetical protein